MTTTRVEHQTGGLNSWGTPRGFAATALESLRLPPITLDVAADVSTTHASVWFGPGATRPDALTPIPWGVSHSGTRWLNPPYSRACRVCPDGVWQKASDDTPGCSERGHASSTIDTWVDRAVVEAARHGEDGRPSGERAPIVLLVPARTDTAWWIKACCAADSVAFISGRLRFLRPGPAGLVAPAGAPFPSALLVLGGSRVPGVPYVVHHLNTDGRRIDGARGYSAGLYG